MGGISLTVHPLFYVFGFYYALTGRIFVFVIYTICAVVHELGHSFVAAGAGYRLNKITLMPFGAVVKGDIDGLKLSDEIKIALAGPIINLALGLFFVAFWWIYPELYAYTDVVAEANFSMALVNFLPIFPLDGGRVLSAVVAVKHGKERSAIVCKITGLIFSILLFAAFVFTIFNKINLSLLFFTLFVLFGTFGKGKDNKYIKLYTALKKETLKRGLPYKKQALYKSATVKKMLSLLDDGAVNEVVVYGDERPIRTLTQEEIGVILEKGNLYAPLEEFI